MSDDLDAFDFNFDDIDNDDNSSNTDKTEEVVKSTAAPKRSGKKSGKTTGSVLRQQKRVPMHQRQPLSVTHRDPNFEYRVANDTPGRIDRLQLAGWVPETGATLGDSVAGKASQMGSVTTAPVGNGTTGVLMKIPKDLYEEDKLHKRKMVDATEEAMLADAAAEVNKAAGGKDEWRGEIRINKAAIDQ